MSDDKNLFECNLHYNAIVAEVLSSLRKDRLWLTVADFAKAAGIKVSTVYWLSKTGGLPLRAPGPSTNRGGRPSARVFLWEFIIWAKTGPEPELGSQLLHRIRKASTAVQADLAGLKSDAELAQKDETTVDADLAPMSEKKTGGGE